MPRAAVEQLFMPSIALEAAGAPFAIRVEADLAAVEQTWRSAEASLIGTPYQSFDTCAAWARTLGAKSRSCVVIASAEDGRPRFLLPLAVRRRGPLQIAGMMGGKHTNFAVPLFAPDAFGDAARGKLVDILARAAWLADIDVFAFPHAPLTWRGAMNPLATLPGVASANIALRGTLDEDAEKTLRRIRGGPALRKLRGKEKKLLAHGELRHISASSEHERAAVIDAFHAQKAEWFRERGITDVFSPPEARAYVATLAASGAFEFHGLSVGGRIVATAAGAVHGGRFSMAFNSYDPEFARMSPGDLLLREIVSDLVRRGVRTMDFGVGDAEYKRHWLDEDEPMRDVAFGVGGPGVIAAASLGFAWRMKRRVKSDQRLARVARWLKRGRASEEKADKAED